MFCCTIISNRYRNWYLAVGVIEANPKTCGPGFGTGSVEAERRAWSFVAEAGRAVKESLLEAGRK